MDKQLEIFLKLLEVTNFNQTELAKRTGKPVERINEWKNWKHLPSFKQLVMMVEPGQLNIRLLRSRETSKSSVASSRLRSARESSLALRRLRSAG
jgi:hypothetical protein